MTRIGLLAVALSACAGSTYYPTHQPGYAQQTVHTTNQSPNGTQTSTSTSTTTFQSSSYEEPAPAPEPAVMPPPPPPEPQCDPRDTREMCIALGVMFDLGEILRSVQHDSCRRASRALNRYADSNRFELRTFLQLEHTQTPIRLEQFQQRHGATATVVIGLALDLETRCDGDQRVHRALERVGFSGLRR